MHTFEESHHANDLCGLVPLPTEVAAKIILSMLCTYPFQPSLKTQFPTAVM